MTASSLYLSLGGVLFGIGFFGLFSIADLIRKVLAFNVMGSGVFLILIAGAYRGVDVAPDPIPHALVLTGVVVAVSATAVFIALVVRIAETSDDPRLPEDKQLD